MLATRRRRAVGSALLLAVGLGLAGCAEELGPETMPTARVRGVIRVGREPVAGGWVEFTPTDGTVGKMRSAPIGPDGSFDADAVAVGANRVGVVGTPIRRPELSHTFDPLTTSIRREVRPDGPPLDIDLESEWVRHQAARAAAARD